MIALSVAGALVVGSAGAGAQPGANSTPVAAPTAAPVASKSFPPLKPGGAAGIKQAQGSDRVALIASGVILAGILAAVLLIDDDDDEATTTTTGTQ